MAHHGDIIEITYNHPTLGAGVFYPKANEGNTYDPGGFRNNDDANGIAGNGDPIISKNRVRGFFEVVVENDMIVRADAQKAADLAASPQNATWTFQVINGAIFSGEGTVVGDINPDVNAGTFTLKVISGLFKKQ
jgi:hypothetical protein